jgi:lipopolysaccharide transport system permease protein
LRKTAGLPDTGKWTYLTDLLYELIRRDMKLRYKRSVLGVAWSLLNPLAQLLVFDFVFRRVLPLGIPNYTVFLFTGLLAWNWFQTSLLTGSGAIVDNRDLVKRPGFPFVVLPVVNVTTNFIHFLLALPVLLVFILLTGITLSPTILLLPAILAIQFLFTTGLVYGVATLQVMMRDTQYLLGILLMLGFYLSPVLYGIETVPEPYRVLYGLNPVAILVTAYRQILLQGELPSASKLLLLSVFAVMLTWAGYRLFQRTSLIFAEEV